MSEFIALLFMLILVILSGMAWIEKLDQKKWFWAAFYGVLVLIEAGITGIVLYLFITVNF